MADSLQHTTDPDRGVHRLTLTRAARRNALDANTIEAMRLALRSAADDPRAAVVVLQGEPPVFCAGLDLDTVMADAGGRDALVQQYGQLLDELEQCPCAIMAVVDGDAVAGGAGLLLKCDVVLAAQGISIGFPGIRRGLVAGVLMPHLLREVGPQRARYLMIGSALLSAEQAQTCGLVNEVVESVRIKDRADHWARRLTGHPRKAVALTRQWLRDLSSARDPSSTHDPAQHDPDGCAPPLHIEPSDSAEP